MDHTNNQDNQNNSDQQNNYFVEIYKLQRMKEQIEQLNEHYHYNILQIFKEHNSHYSSNSNGIFINISNIDKGLYNKINNYLQTINKQVEYLDSIEKQQEEERNAIMNQQ